MENQINSDLRMDNITSNDSNVDCENPSDKVFLKICFVCKDVAKSGQEHLRNYGGIVCYSCRAFWRRCHQRSRQPDLFCRKTNQCIVSVETRKCCQKCRYNRCLLAGMKADAVLDSGQKKVRFRKLLKKKQKIRLALMKKKTSLLQFIKNSNNIETIKEKKGSGPTCLNNLDDLRPKNEAWRSETVSHGWQDSPLDLSMPKNNLLSSLKVAQITNDFIRVMSQLG